MENADPSVAAAIAASLTKKRRTKQAGPPVRPVCVECGKDFSNQSALSKHKLTHSDERRFSCNLCGKSFKRQDHLNGHMLTHRDKKPYACEFEGCEKTYCDARSLRRHKENHHSSMSMMSQQQQPPTHLNRTQLAAHPQLNLAFIAQAAAPLVNRIQYAPPVQAHSQTSQAMMANGALGPQIQHRPPQQQQQATIVNGGSTQRSQSQVSNLAPNLIASVSNQSRSQLSGSANDGSAPPQSAVRSLTSNVVVENGLNSATTHLQYLALSQHNQQPPQPPQAIVINQQKLMNGHVDTQHNSSSHLALNHLAPLAAHRQMQQQARQQGQGANNDVATANNLLHQLLTQQMQHAGHSPARGPSPAVEFQQQQMRQRGPSPNVDPSYQMRPNGRMSQSPEEQVYQKYGGQQQCPPSPCTPVEQNSFFNHQQQQQQQQQPQTPTLQPPPHKPEWPLMTINYDNNNNQASATDRHVRFEQQQHSIQNSYSQQQGHYCDNSYPNTPQAPVSAPPLMSPHHQGVPHGGHYGHQQQVTQRRASHPGHSLPCTPTAPVTFTFSAHHLQQYHQEQSMVNGQCHSTSTPPTPNTAPGSHSYNQQQQQYEPEPSPHYAAQASPYEASPLPQQQQQVAQVSQNGQQPQQQFMGTYSSQEEYQEALDIDALCSSVVEQMEQQQAAATMTTMASQVDQSQYYEPISAQNTPNPNLLAPPQEASLYSSRPQAHTGAIQQQQQVTSRPLPVIHEAHNAHNTVQQTLLQNLHHVPQLGPPNGLHAAVTTKLQQVISQQQQQQQQQQNNHHQHQEHQNELTTDSQVNKRQLHTTLANTNSNNNMNLLHAAASNILSGNNDHHPPTTIYYNDNSAVSTNNVIQAVRPQTTNTQQPQLPHPYRPVAIESISSAEENGQMSGQQSQRSTLRSSSPNLVMNLSPEPEDQPHDEEADQAMDTTTSATDRINAASPDVSKLSKQPFSGKVIAQKQQPMDVDEEIDDDVFVTPPMSTQQSTQPPLPAPLPTAPLPMVHPPLPRPQRTSILNEPLGSKINSGQSPKRTKHKPEPLYIPPHVNAFGYQSRLRSPRLWDGNAIHSAKSLAESRSDISHDNNLSHDGHINKATKISPPPYTPPPMLSPSRTASGLYYWAISAHSGSGPPKPAAFTFGHPRRQSSLGLSNAESKEEMVPTPTTAYEFEPQFDQIPETDVQPHVNVGPQYQARIPAYCANQTESLKKYKSEKADLVWSPNVIANDWLPEEVEAYLNVACTACVPGSGRNKEYAYHVLYETNGDLNEALCRLMEPRPTLKKDHPLVGYQYPETDLWTIEQVEQYHRALVKCDKDFNAVAKEIGTKTVKQCVQFYYLWKKVCPDDYKRLRIFRRKREQSGYYFRAADPEPEPVITNGHSNTNGDNSSDEEMTNDGASSAQGGTSERDAASPAPSSVGSSSVREYPCKVCGKIFNKIKSRSAHMKIHGAGAAKC